jgi:RNA polymerase sigma factor (sigma-70 family)
MPESAIGALLDKLGTECAREAWTEFLTLYSDRIYTAARRGTEDEESAADCYLFICEQLSKSDFRRLRRFQPEGPARFETWLGVVCRNLCLDWLRSRHGRNRPFRSLQRLSSFDNEVFRLHVQQGMTLNETFNQLLQQNPAITASDVEAADEHIEQALSSRQRWSLQQRAGERQSISIDDRDADTPVEPEDPHPSPELAMVDQEDRRKLGTAIDRLAPEQRLLIRMRFEEGLSLAEIARLTGAGDAQRIHHRLTQALGELRKHFSK